MRMISLSTAAEALRQSRLHIAGQVIDGMQFLIVQDASKDAYHLWSSEKSGIQVMATDYPSSEAAEYILRANLSNYHYDHWYPVSKLK